MPAPECSWTPSQKLPAFQVCAAKRKCSEEFFMEDDETCCASTQKRMCHMAEVMGAEETPKNSMEMFQEDCHSVQYCVTPLQHAQNQYQVMTYNCQTEQKSPDAPSWSGHHTPVVPDIVEMNNNEMHTMTGNNDLFMDLSDEVYSTAPLNSLPNEQPGDSMDSDFVPDARQYKIHAEYCKEYCGYGSISPRSGKVRCYCKPSWEGMLEVRPYISDVY